MHHVRRNEAAEESPAGPDLPHGQKGEEGREAQEHPQPVARTDLPADRERDAGNGGRGVPESVAERDADGRGEHQRREPGEEREDPDLPQESHRAQPSLRNQPEHPQGR